MGIEELNLSDNEINLADRKFTNALAQNGSLQVLCLSHNKIGPEGGKWLANALKVNKTVRKLVLDGNEIGDKGAKSLAFTLMVNESIEEMHLGSNGIGDGGAASLAASFKKNQSIRVVGLGGNNIGSNGAEAFLDSLGCNRSIQSLSLTLGIFAHQRVLFKRVRAKIQNILDDPQRKVAQLEKTIAKHCKTIDARDEEIASKTAEVEDKEHQAAWLSASLDVLKKKEMEQEAKIARIIAANEKAIKRMIAEISTKDEEIERLKAEEDEDEESDEDDEFESPYKLELIKPNIWHSILARPHLQ